MCAGEGVGLEPGDVAGGRVRGAARPPRMRRDVVLLLPRPALARPPLAPFVATALAEMQPARIAHRTARDRELLDACHVTGALVVVSKALVACRYLERARVNSEPALRLLIAQWRRDLRPLVLGEQPRDRQRLAHRLAVLELVTEYHLAQHAIVDSALADQLRHTRADLRHIRLRVLGRERVDLAADLARGLERVVEVREIRAQKLQAAVAVPEPKILVGGDVTEVPRQRAHDRRGHAP